MRILVVNSGSSSLKLRVIEGDDEVAAASDLPAIDDGQDPVQLAELVRDRGHIDAVGHRIVHGGTYFTGPVRVDRDVRQRLRDLTDLAPTHQPKSLAALIAVTAVLPEVPAVACFDTAFHASLPAASATYALPRVWREKWELRRYGFHGLSHSYVARRAAHLLGRSEDGLRLITCHLGAGASLAAVRDGRSVDTTMGFTPLEGLVMASRSGSVDPGLLLWLERSAGVSADELAEALEHRSGLLGLSGTADMREILTASEAGAVEARLALDVYIHRLCGGIAAMAAALGGLDGLVFTGGVGENSPTIRQRAADSLGFLGINIDRDLNSDDGADRHIGADGSPVPTLVVASREDLQIAREVRQVLVG